MPRIRPKRPTRIAVPVMLPKPSGISIGQKVVTTKIIRTDRKRSLPVGTLATVTGISGGSYKILARNEYAWAAMSDLKLA